MAFCKWCGGAIGTDGDFCSICGRRIRNNSATLSLDSSIGNTDDVKEMNEKGLQDIESVEEEKDDTKEKKFTPIQAESKNTETYDIAKDEKFSFLLKLQELERERGIDVLRIMQKLEENGKKVVDKKV